MAVNKVEFGNQTIMDITDTSATPDGVVEGQVFYAASGLRSVGTLTDATQTTHGLMSAADKTKLDGLTSTEQIDISGKADKTDTVLNTTLSRGRKANTTVGTASFAFGDNVEASGNYSHAEGNGTTASGVNTHAEGYNTTASGHWSHAEGRETTASGQDSHAEGYHTIASGSWAHAEGYWSKAGSSGHAEGLMSQANTDGAHAEGQGSIANGQGAHAEGISTVANGGGQHVSGWRNIPDDYSTWSEWVSGTEYTIGDKVKITTTTNNETTVAGYICKIANNDSTFTTTNWNTDFKMNYAEIVGNGDTKAGTYSNARALDWEGNGYYAGDIYVGCGPDSTGGTKLARMTDIPSALDIATVEETHAIIDMYGEEPEVGIVVETVFIVPEEIDPENDIVPYYETTMDTADIINAFRAGNNVIIHFPETENTIEYGCYEAAASFVAEQTSNNEDLIYMSFNINLFDGKILTFNAYTAENGKLHIPVSIDY